MSDEKQIEFVWHARRFWIQEPTGKQHRGWNTRFEPCWIIKRTAKRVEILSPSLGKMFLDRHVLERDGKVYHSKPHEWFYSYLPAVDPEAPIARSSPALRLLGLAAGCSRDDVRRAYKRLARKRHPDTGGSHQAFLELQKAYSEALATVR